MVRHYYIVLYIQHYDSHNFPMIPTQTTVISYATFLLCLKIYRSNFDLYIVTHGVKKRNV